MEFQDIKKDLIDGQNMGGLPQKIYFGKWDDVATWPTKPDSPANIAANGQLTGDVEMKPGTRMFELYVTDDTGELEFESVGDVDGKSFIMHLRLFNPGLKEELLGFMNAVKNDNLVFIVPTSNDQKFLLGDALRPAIYVGPDDAQGTTKETAGRSGMSMHFQYKTPNVYTYTGTVPLTPAASV